MQSPELTINLTQMETNDARSDTMNLDFNSNNYTTTLFIGGADDGESQESSSTTYNINDGDSVKLFIDGFGEVGAGTFLEA